MAGDGFVFLGQPTGTTAGTVATGNHHHAGTDIDSGTVAYARLPTGTAASTVAIGDHTHTAPTSLAAVGAAAGTDSITVQVTGDTQQRLIVNANGVLEWGSGTAAVDTNLYRGAASELWTDDRFVMQGVGASSVCAAVYIQGESGPRFYVRGSGELQWGPNTGTPDTNLYRSAANMLKTDDTFIVSGSGDATYGNLSVICGGSGFIISNSAESKRWRINAGSSTTQLFFSEVGVLDWMTVRAGGSVAIGKASLATNATVGFIYAPSMAGAASGTPTTETGYTALHYDTTNDRFKAYNGAWKTYAPILDGSATLDFGSISAGATAELTITVTGAAAGDVVYLGPPAALTAGLMATGYVSATDTVTVRLHNTTASPIDPASATWKARVGK